jgi:hypothetical protein
LASRGGRYLVGAGPLGRRGHTPRTAHWESRSDNSNTSYLEPHVYSQCQSSLSRRTERLAETRCLATRMATPIRLTADTTPDWSACRRPRAYAWSDRRTILAIRVLDGDLAVAEGEEIASGHLHAPAICVRARERPPTRHDCRRRDAGSSPSARRGMTRTRQRMWCEPLPD